MKRALFILIIMSLILTLPACKKDSPTTPYVPNQPNEPDTPSEPDAPTTVTYTLKVECLDMTSLRGDKFVNKLLVSDAQVELNGELQDQGQYEFTLEFKLDESHEIELDFVGSVHPRVLCVRLPGNSTNLVQTLYGKPAQIDLKALGTDVKLELYRIPDWVKMGWITEALQLGSAIYDHDVMIYLVNEGYRKAVWEEAKQTAIPKIEKALSQINMCLLGISSILDVNATSGDIRVRMSPDYYNPGHGEFAPYGIIQYSQILISAVDDGFDFLEEFYQAHGVSHDIGTVGGGLVDEIADKTDTLNRFGKALMRINYFLDPDTFLGQW